MLYLWGFIYPNSKLGEHKFPPAWDGRSDSSHVEMNGTSVLSVRGTARPRRKKPRSVTIRKTILFYDPARR